MRMASRHLPHLVVHVIVVPQWASRWASTSTNVYACAGTMHMCGRAIARNGNATPLLSAAVKLQHRPGRRYGPTWPRTRVTYQLTRGQSKL